MVLIQIKQGDHDTFLYECPSSTSNDVAVRDIVKIWNNRLRLAQLAGAIRELGQHGPMKKPDKAGIDNIQEKYNGEVIERNEFYKEDPSGNRTGNGVGPRMVEVFEEVARDAEAVLSKVNK